MNVRPAVFPRIRMPPQPASVACGVEERANGACRLVRVVRGQGPPARVRRGLLAYLPTRLVGTPYLVAGFLSTSITVPIAIGAGRSPFAGLEEHLKLQVVEEERFSSGALAQILVPKR